MPGFSTLAPGAATMEARGARRWRAVRRWALIALAVLPFQLLLLQHLLSGPTATGLLQYDSAYYVANGREVFERGNGFAHPNPYDPDPAAPVIYFHWLTWLLGAGVKFLHLDPGALLVGVGLIATLACGALTLRLVEIVLPDPRGRGGLYLLTMWGGGVLCLGAVVVNCARGAPWSNDPLAFDVGDGWWFLNWGRNLVLPTETVYHGLVAAAWIGVLRRRWGLAIGMVGALAATHPFSGAQHLLILGAWLGWLAWRERTAAAWRRVGLVVLLGAAFGTYYFWYLNLFPSHRQLAAVWSTGWQLPLTSILLAFGPVGAVAGWRWLRERGHWSDTEGFLVVAGAMTFLLMKHDWFIAAHQPAHFSRGYNWLPWWLLALPQLQAWGWASVKRGRVWGSVGIGLAAGLLVADNTTFLVHEWRSGGSERLRLTPEQREMLAWMDRENLDGVLLCAETRLSYLAATYSSVRPYYGHLNNTPDIHQRWTRVAAWQLRGERGPWLDTIDYVLIPRWDPPVGFDRAAWRELHRNRDYLLLGRAGKPWRASSPG